MAKTNELDAAFRATSYRVFLPAGVVELRIDQPNEALKSWLSESGNSMFAIVTAHNPESQQLDAVKNAERQSQLECELLEGNYEPYACENHPDDPEAPFEESCFVPDIQLEDAKALAEDFEQNAIVYGGADAIPHLIWIIEAE